MNKTMKYLIVAVMLFIAGCSSEAPNTESEIESKPLILSSFYPVEEITKHIVGNTTDVEVLIGYGVEPHSFEPTPSQVVKLSKTQVFITMGGMFEHIEENIINANSNLFVIDATHDVHLTKGDEHTHEEEHETHEESEHMHEEKLEGNEEDEHKVYAHGEYDPHIWLDIHNMEAMTNEIVEKLVELYPENKELYTNNAENYIEKLETLESEFENKLSACKNSVIIVNHKAFGYLAEEYGFEQVSVAGFSPESEPSPSAIKNVVDKANEYNLKYVFTEGQLDAKVSTTIANDIDGEVLELNPLKINEGEDYFSIMRNNLDNLALGLGCEN